MTNDYDQMEAVMRVAREAQIEAELLIECVQRRLIPLAGNRWEEEAVEAARRVRRLSALGVNLPGIEVVFHMRRQLISYQRELDEVRAEMDRMRREQQREVSRLLREVSETLGR